ncbi:NAD(P)-binding protein [Nocardia sp. NPDC004711]
MRQAIEECEAAPLLMSMVHVTGDVGLLDEFGPRLTIEEPGNHYRTGTRPAVPPGTYPDDVVADVRAREVLTPDSVAALEVPDDELFQRMAIVCTAQRVDAEFVPILLEQAGFIKNQRRVPVTVTPPPDFEVIVIGAGINAGIKLEEAGFPFTIFEERDDIGGTWQRNTYPGAAVDTPSHTRPRGDGRRTTGAGRIQPACRRSARRDRLGASGAQVNGYYRNTAGRAVVPCPWRLVDYWTMLRAPHPEDLTFLPHRKALS